MSCLTVFALFMWLLVVYRSSDYWLGISARVTLTALVDVEVCLGISSCVTRSVPRGSRGLIIGSTGRGRPIIGSTGRGRPLLYPASVFPTRVILSNMVDSLGVLGLEMGSTVREVYVQYRFLAQILHPNKHDTDVTGMKSEEAVDIFKLVINAQQYLWTTVRS